MSRFRRRRVGSRLRRRGRARRRSRRLSRRVLTSRGGIRMS